MMQGHDVSIPGSSAAVPSLALAAVTAVITLPGCGVPADDPWPVVRRDSAEVEIVEARRPLWSDGGGWTLGPTPLVDLTVSGTGPMHEFGSVVGMARFSDGSLAVADRLLNEVRLYSPDGDFLVAAGREGEGPGEFSGGIESMANATGDTVVVLDWESRASAFGPGLALVNTFGFGTPVRQVHDLGDGTLAAEFFAPMGTGSDVAGLVRTPTVLWRFGFDGSRLDSIGGTAGYEEYLVMSGRGGVASWGTLFPRAAHVATRGGRVYVGNADEMEVEERTATGQLVRLLRIPGYPLALPTEVLHTEREDFLGDNPSSTRREVAARTPSSGTRPAYDDIIVDPAGALWLLQFRGRTEMGQPQRWEIIDAEGVWLGSLDLPPRFRVLGIELDAVLGVWRDELDVEHPQMLRLDRGG